MSLDVDRRRGAFNVAMPLKGQKTAQATVPASGAVTVDFTFSGTGALGAKSPR